ncbi:MAG: RNA methyltransferase [Firmicutes bacterium]|nr:RNA methyltransferase [Bacillota bacterium]
MERITSRKNQIIALFRALASDAAERRARGLYVCDGEKQLRDAVAAGTKVDIILAADEADAINGVPTGATAYGVPIELLQYASPLTHTRGPVFAVRMPDQGTGPISRAIVLEGVQDPGNVGAVIRTANALGIDEVLLVGNCADPYGPKAVRAAMGAVFRQRLRSLTLEGLEELLRQSGLSLYGAALSETARNVQKVDITHCAVAVGSEGRGLSAELLKLCAGQIRIPMRPESESLNAAVAAAIVMWEMKKTL